MRIVLVSNASFGCCIQFLPANFTVILFHYDGNMDQWWDLEWSSKAIHIVAHNQTKWYSDVFDIKSNKIVLLN